MIGFAINHFSEAAGQNPQSISTHLGLNVIFLVRNKFGNVHRDKRFSTSIWLTGENLVMFIQVLECQRAAVNLNGKFGG